MMSKKQFTCMLTLHLVYLLVGASIFYHIESPLEAQQRAEDKLERLEIQNLLYENYVPNDPEKQTSILNKLSVYCGKPMYNSTAEEDETPLKWDFYHSFFFSYTVVSTIGYGNLAPTTHLSRILMIFYALFGIPINGILLANLGEYFGLQLISVYRKYKRRNVKRADNLSYCFNNLGMLGQIFLYLVPGFLFFIFLPACLFVVFEDGWDFVAAVYYAFVTLTTIGFGDLVAGTANNGFQYGQFIAYEIFLIIWITFGLGYIVMLLGFITSGMRSERVHRLEQKFAMQFKSTQNKILQGFTRDIAVIRKIINEANLIKLKPVYVDETPRFYRSKSCPNFTFDVEPRFPVTKRKRANSENIQLTAKDMLRIQSDTDLLGIDKDKTFTASAIVKPAELLARVVNVLGGFEQPHRNTGVHMFDDEHILASEKPPVFSIGQNIIPNSPKRIRALSIAVPNHRKESVSKFDHDHTWTNGDSAEKFRKEANARSGKLSLPSTITPPAVEDSQPRNFLQRIFRKSNSTESPAEYVKNTMIGRLSNTHKVNVSGKETPRRGSIFSNFFFGGQDNKGNNELDAYKEKTKRGRHSIFPTFDFHREEDDNAAKAYKEKTKKGRHSIFPTFDFSENDDAETARAYQQKPKRHSIFPTFDFSEDDDDYLAQKYKENTRSGRHSIFPTFDFSDTEDKAARDYKEKTKRGRHSIFPTFDFSDLTSNDEEDTIDEDEVRKYQNRTKKGRLSLFPTFGRSKKDDDDTMPESSDELVDYKNKTRHGRVSLFPTFGKDRKTSTPEENSNDLEASIKQYQKQTKRGRNSLFAGDIEHYRNSTQGGRHSLFSSELENYRNKTKRGRPSLFDPNVNISNLPESEQVEVLENTSVADLLRALATIETVRGDSDTTSPAGLLDLINEPVATPARRRGSLRPDFALPTVSTKEETEEATGPRRRRISARAAAPHFTPTLATVVAGTELQITAAAARENRMSMLTHPPPPYSETETSTEEGVQKPRVRRYSPAPSDPGRSVAPVQRLFTRMRNQTSAEEGDSTNSSLTDVIVDNNLKDNT
ncbi:open rectifier potassium channel protein 1 [Galleria mellonella]|uniref:Open rectifier potassium channel protein 1 n=1 Tax=Galleria mellonella TaxID=7137 RepID=A0A6J1WMK1_GALME|nr:open rectifier potassium channel protein 1 [Galleria mellonella]